MLIDRLGQSRVRSEKLHAQKLRCWSDIILKYNIRGLLEKYLTFGREKETGLPGALDT